MPSIGVLGKGKVIIDSPCLSLHLSSPPTMAIFGCIFAMTPALGNNILCIRNYYITLKNTRCFSGIGRHRRSLTAAYLDTEPQLLAKWASLNPLGRIGRPDELRGVVTWLASDASTFCTGSEYVVVYFSSTPETYPVLAGFVCSQYPCQWWTSFVVIMAPA